MQVERIAEQAGVTVSQARKVTQLLTEGATIPFIARYRKEATGSLDEVQIGKISKANLEFIEFEKRKETILKAIDEQGQLTPELRKTITDTWDVKRLEDLYLPYKRKQQTKAAIARKAGYEGLAKIIMAQRSENIRSQARRFGPEDEAIQGALHIIAEWISENGKVRDIVRQLFDRKATLTSKLIKGKKEEAAKYKDYFDYTSLLKRTPSHRLLAILRAENEGFIRSKVDVEFEEIQQRITRFYIRNRSEASPYIEEAIEDSLKRLILPSIRNEVVKDAKDKADDEAIEVFTRNAKALLLGAPLGAKRVLGIDPGFRTGCKVVCLDEQAELLHSTAIFPHPPQKKVYEAENKILSLIKKFRVEAIAVGDGTAGKETYQWLRKLLKQESVEIFLVNEDGASIYSASEIAREEFPDEDITVRGAVSIARRLIDPLAELVKIDPKSIGVGQYQHDVNQKKLKESLTETVISCVNKVGVNVNTASKNLLAYVSGLGPGLAQNIINVRNENGGYQSISDLKKVPRLGSKAYEQCAGFLRIKGGMNPLDNTGVHPESYPVVRKILKDLDKPIEAVIAREEVLSNIDLKNYITDSTGMPTLKDIITELKKPGLDPREKAQEREYTEGLESIDDLRTGQIITGIVTNLTKFGAFLDIGIKENALLHISQIVDKYISDPAEVLKLNEEIKVKVLEVDKERKRISVTKKGL